MIIKGLQVICNEDVPIRLQTEEISDESYLEAGGGVGLAPQASGRISKAKQTATLSPGPSMTSRRCRRGPGAGARTTAPGPVKAGQEDRTDDWTTHSTLFKLASLSLARHDVQHQRREDAAAGWRSSPAAARLRRGSGRRRGTFAQYPLIWIMINNHDKNNCK
jgi:hypothetical protein